MCFIHSRQQIGRYNTSNLSDPDDYDIFNTVSNNILYNIATELESCVGIGAGYVSHLLISNNDVRNLSWTGITIGWGWDKFTCTWCFSNLVTRNIVTGSLV